LGSANSVASSPLTPALNAFTPNQADIELVKWGHGRHRGWFQRRSDRTDVDDTVGIELDGRNRPVRPEFVPPTPQYVPPTPRRRGWVDPPDTQ
jgi:hypothetical protein